MRIVCPLCKRVLENAPDDFAPRPFCSARCKLVDLDNWLTGAYRVSTRLDGTEGTDPVEIEALSEAPTDRR